ncbi:MAG: hypothetical protein CVT49_00865 [candidate division Zixibacteria bacterium HGW-Zixibacteria-1]|nr:MAG: hypothetical protein CVT49_00865 [candidate division Zixibacteria bacterium HGW-Zixibacteria-1]
MRRNWFLMALACLVILSFGQANATTITAKVSPEISPNTVMVGEPFTVDLYMQNDFGDLSGVSIPLFFYSPDGSITNVTHRNIAGQRIFEWRTQTYTADSSIFQTPTWTGYWLLLKDWFGFSWDGVLPDTINFSGASLFGWGLDPAPVNYINFAYKIDQPGTICIDSCMIPGVTPAGKFDWLFDDPGANFSGPYCFTVYDPFANEPPVLDPIGNKTVNEGALLTFGVSASDANAGDVIHLYTSTLPTGASFVDNGNKTGTFSWTPTFTQSNTHPVTFFATDGKDTVSEAISITVNNVNQKPVITVPGAQNVNENVLLTFAVSATDPDGTIPTLSTSALPAGANFTNNGNGTGSFNWTPTYEQSGAYPITFYAADGSATDSGVVNITVNNVNREPVLTVPGPQSTNENIFLTFNVSATDADGAIPALSSSTLPTGASFTDNGNGTGTFEWTPTFDQSGDYPITFYASDGDATVSDVVDIAVNNVNRAPVLAQVAVGPVFVDEGQQLVLDITATDPDGTFPTLSAENVMMNASIVDNGDGTGQFIFNPDTSQAGDYLVIIIASDGALADSEAVAIFVNDVVPEIELAIDVTPRNYTLLEGGDKPDSIYVQELFGRNIPFTLSGKTGWLLIPAVGYNTPDYGKFSIATAGLASGQYFDTLTITANDAINSPVTIPISLTVEEVIVPALEVMPTSFDFTLNEGAALTDSVHISETHGMTVQFEISNSSSWLTLPVFVTPPSTPATIEFGVNSAGLDPGIYHDTIVVEGPLPAKDIINIPVVLTVNEVIITQIAVEPTVFDFTLEYGEEVIAIDSVNVYEVNGQSITFWTNNREGWLYLDTIPVSPLITPKKFAIDINTAGLAPGTYFDTIWVWGEGAVNSPQYIPVGLTVHADYVLQADPAALDYTLEIGGYRYDSLFISEMFDRNVEFTTWHTENWLGVEPYFPSPYTTPRFLHITITDSNLAVGNTYYDTIRIVSAENDPPLFSSIEVPVSLTIVAPTPVVETFPSSFYFTLDPGDSLINQVLSVYETHGMNVPFMYETIFGSSWLELLPSVITVIPQTPDSIFFNIRTEGLSVGYHSDTILIYNPMDSVTFETVKVPVIVNVQPSQLPVVINTWPMSFNWTVNQGEMIYDSLFVFDTSGQNVMFTFFHGQPWLTVEPFGMPPYVTPKSLLLVANTSMLSPGVYIDSVVIYPGFEVPYFPPVSVPVMLTVLGPVTKADSVWIPAVPAVPGNDVVIPVYFRNFDPLSAIHLPLTWNSGSVMLDGITFDGTRVAYVQSKPVAIDNDTWHAEIAILPTFEPDVPAGRGMLAKLHFSVRPGATEAQVTIDTSSYFTGFGLTFISSDLDIIHPTFIAGKILIDTAAAMVCGRVIDDEDNEIEGATVELWDDFPGGGVILTETTDINGQFLCHANSIFPFDAYAYKEGYYPGLVEEIGFNEIGFDIVLTGVPDVTPTNEWVNFYCDENSFYNVPLPIGSVVDAYDPDGVHCGTWYVTEAGKYGLMPVYRDDIYTIIDEGAEPGDEISFFINGYPANAVGDRFWTENGDSKEVCLDVYTIEERTIALDAGWNLISWNVDTPDDDIEALLASISGCVEVVLGFERGGMTYDPTLPEFSTLWSADHYHGYWVKMTCPQTLVVTGVPIAVTTPINLEAGWNLVSYLPNMPDTTPHALTSVYENLIIALSFDGTGLIWDPSVAPEYSTMQHMYPGLGYWLKVMSDDILVYPGSGPSVVFKQEFAGYRTAKAAQSQVMASRQWINIYSRELILDGRAVPTGSEIEVVAADGRVVGAGLVGENGRFGFVPVYGDDPLTTDREGLRSNEEFSLLIDGVGTNETFIWTTMGDKVEIGAVTAKTEDNLLPNDFSLGQNYPNPFNPVTNISFSVPQAMKASIEVYNILGEMVKTVFDGMAEAGRNEVVWDGTSSSGEPVASGIYFYRMKAGSFETSKKMVLMK